MKVQFDNFPSPNLARVMASALAIALFWTSSSTAHFVWLDSEQHDEGKRGVFFFGEGPDNRDYHLPESLAETSIVLRQRDGTRTKLNPQLTEEENFVGLRTDVAPEGPFVLESVCQYGVYHGTLLTYAAKHISSSAAAEWSLFGTSDSLPLEIVPVANDEGIRCTVYRQGQPLAGVGVKLASADGESITVETDGDGHAMFKGPVSGRLGFLAKYEDTDQAGSLDDSEYTSATHYATLLVDYQSSHSVPAQPAAQKFSDSDLPCLPTPIASFGGVAHRGWLYVYGGHTGGAHEHSRDNLSDRFSRIQLPSGAAWEDLPMQTPLQGLALVAHDGSIYRVGGMNARNAADEDDDLYSVVDFARFDPQQKQWHAMPPLPEPRSSHDAVVVGDELFVVGGWLLEGPGHGTWHTTALVFDLTNPKGSWREVSPPPFARRALAASHWQGHVVVVGGMDDDSEVSRNVDLYHVSTGEWSRGPDLPGDGIHGFGLSAWNRNGQLYASGLSGNVYCLAADGSEWTSVARLRRPRFFHQLVPVADSDLLAVAGASFEDGHLADVEWLQLGKTTQARAK